MSPRSAAALVAVLAFCAAAPATAAPEVEARLASSSVDIGSAVPLLVSVTNPGGNVADPQFTVPDGLELLGSSRSQNFSWVNGRSTTEIVYRFEIGGTVAGTYTIGPIRVTIGGQTYLSGTLTLRVRTGAASLPGGSAGDSPAALVVEATPREPYVGQPVRLVVRLVQRYGLAEVSGYAPPATPGFWTEAWSEPEIYEARQSGRTVKVVERRQRMYPLAAGEAAVGEALATVTPASAAYGDPFFRGGGALRPLELRSPPVHLRVRPLPAGAPAGFDGAVGVLSATWSADRTRTPLDQPVTVRLDVRGRGNLPLLHAPPFAPQTAEVFASTAEDSLAPAGEMGGGRKRFQWTILPHHAGRIEISAPLFAWFDPEAGAYVRAALPAVVLEVGPAAGAGNENPEGFPVVFVERASRPGGTTAEPWRFALIGVALGFAVRWWRAGGRPSPDAAERAMQREWLRVVGLAHGPDFWRAADEASAWAEQRGAQVLRLREDIAAARYGRAAVHEDDVRRRLVERIGEAMPAATPAWPWRASGIVLAVVAIGAIALSIPRTGSERLAARAQGADAAARAGRVSAAESAWRALWREAPGDAGLAARLGWSALRAGQVPMATAWVLSGDAREPRDRSLAWLRDRVRESGGLLGARGRALPLRSIEWSLLALAFALGAVVVWPRRLAAVALVALAVGAAAALPFERAWRQREPERVVVRPVPLAGTEIELEPGQVVRRIAAAGDSVLVHAGSGLAGRVPADALVIPEGLR